MLGMAASPSKSSLQPSVDSPSPGQRRRLAHRGGAQHYSQHAIGLGFQNNEKWADFNDGRFFPPYGTDRTHGIKGRTPNDGSAARAASASVAASAGKPKASRASFTGEKANNNNTQQSGGNGDNDANANGRRGLYGNYAPMPNVELHGDAAPPAGFYDIPDFSGNWRCTKTEGSWDVYLSLCGMSPQSIKLAQGARFGAGLAMQDITMPHAKDAITIVNSSFKTSWVGGVVQTAHVKQHLFIDGSQQQVAGGGTINLRWENKSLVSRYEVKSPLPSFHDLFDVMILLASFQVYDWERKRQAAVPDEAILAGQQHVREDYLR